MAIFRSDFSKGLRTPPTPFSAGDVKAARFTYTFNDAANSSDIIEIGVLPARSRVMSAFVITEGTFTGITANIGLMSGTVGSTDTGRTSGSELFSAVNLATANTTVQQLSLSTGPLIAVSESDRGIGVVLSGSVSASSSKILTVILLYTQS